jgi:hypothetical protein
MSRDWDCRFREGEEAERMVRTSFSLLALPVMKFRVWGRGILGGGDILMKVCRVWVEKGLRRGRCGFDMSGEREVVERKSRFFRTDNDTNLLHIEQDAIAVGLKVDER